MKIEDKRTPKTSLTFKDLSVGDVFIIRRGGEVFYVKTTASLTDQRNSITLPNCLVSHMPEDAEVIKVKATLVIEHYNED